MGLTTDLSGSVTVVSRLTPSTSREEVNDSAFKSGETVFCINAVSVMPS